MKDYSHYYPTFKEVILENGRMIFEQQLNDFEGKDVLVDGVAIKALVKYHQNPLNEFRESRKITLWHEDDIKRGSYVKTVEDDRLFLVISEINRNDMVKYALIRETNHNLKWIDKEANKLIIKPCIVSVQTLYTTGVKREKQLVVPDGKTGIQLPYDEDTKKLRRNDQLIFNNIKYKITHENKVEFPGLLALICEEELPGGTTSDDMENEIANRYTFDSAGNKIDRLAQTEPPDVEEPEESPTEDNFAIQITGQDSVMVMTEGTYTAKVFNNGAEVMDKTVAFTISPTSLATIKSQSDNKCIVKANMNFNTGEVILKAKLVDDEVVFTDKKIIISGY